jgi:hypothetical protein
LLATVFVPHEWVGATEDTSIPRVAELSFDPTTVDTSAAPAPITLTARIVDNPAGLRIARVSFESPSGDQR